MIQVADKSITAVYKVKYDCKGSVRFTTDNENFPISDVYVLRPFSTDVKELTLTLTVKK